MEKRPPVTPQEEDHDKAMDLIYEMAAKAAKEQGVVGEGVTVEEFKSMPLREVLEKLKEKGITEFTIQL